MLNAGETYEVAFNANNFEAIHGYQFTLNFDQSVLEFNSLRAGELTNLDDSNFGLSLLEEGVITTSWTSQTVESVRTSDGVFYITFEAKADVQLSEVINISSQYTQAEAYDGNMKYMNVGLRFDNGDVADGFQLHQNRPNPFNQETLIGFELPDAGEATLTIFDVSGRVLMQVEGDYNKGFNQVVINANDLQGTGLLYYQLVSADYQATKRMVLSTK